ncbi:ribosomal protein L28e [Phycomyces nitens]|nr:ribosomal protein L28e [Phycomyces nitens]
MSADLVWELIKNNNSFLVKRSGVQFSCELNNLTNLNTFKYSGVANAKTVSIHPAVRGIRVALTKPKKIQTPAKAVNATIINKSRRHTAKSVANLIARSQYRPDLRKAALARATACINVTKPKKVAAAKPKKGIRANKAPAKHV